MTIAEFKAWLEGFEAALTGAPTPEQWETIKAKIAQLREPAGLPSGYRPHKWLPDHGTVPLATWRVPLHAH